MRTPKLIGMFLGMGVLLFGFLVWFGNSYVPTTNIPSVKKPDFLNDKNSASITGVVDTRPLRLKEDVPQNSVNGPTETNEGAGDVQEDDLLDIITKKIAEDVAKQNPGGPVDFDGEKGVILSNPERLVNEILIEEFESINKLALSDNLPTVADSELKIIKNASKTDQEIYLESFKRIIEEELSGLRTDISRISESELREILSAHDRTISRFYKLAAPEQLLDVHKKEIALLTQQQSFFEKLQYKQQQPIKALMALNYYMNNTLKEMDRLAIEIANFVKDKKLTIKWP